MQVALGVVIKNTTNVTLLLRGGQLQGSGTTCTDFCTAATAPGDYFGQAGNPYYLKCYDARNALNYLRIAYNNSAIAVPQQPYYDIVDCMRIRFLMILFIISRLDYWLRKCYFMKI